MSKHACKALAHASIDQGLNKRWVSKSLHLNLAPMQGETTKRMAPFAYSRSVIRRITLVLL